MPPSESLTVQQKQYPFAVGVLESTSGTKISGSSSAAEPRPWGR